MDVVHVLPASAAHRLLQQRAQLLGDDVEMAVGLQFLAVSQVQDPDIQNGFVVAVVDLDDVGRLQLQKLLPLAGIAASSDPCAYFSRVEKSTTWVKHVPSYRMAMSRPPLMIIRVRSGAESLIAEITLCTASRKPRRCSSPRDTQAARSTGLKRGSLAIDVVFGALELWHAERQFPGFGIVGRALGIRVEIAGTSPLCERLPGVAGGE